MNNNIYLDGEVNGIRDAQCLVFMPHIARLLFVHCFIPAVRTLTHKQQQQNLSLPSPGVQWLTPSNQPGQGGEDWEVFSAADD